MYLMYSIRHFICLSKKKTFSDVTIVLLW